MGLLLQYTGLWFDIDSEDPDHFIQLKEDFLKNDTQQLPLVGIQAYLREVSKLGFEDTPDYEGLAQLLRGMNDTIGPKVEESVGEVLSVVVQEVKWGAAERVIEEITQLKKTMWACIKNLTGIIVNQGI